MTGLIVCAAVLAAATALGLVWRRRNGVLRVVGTGAQTRPRGHPAVAGREASGANGTGPASAAAGSDGDRAQVTVAATRAGVLTAAQLGRPLGSRGTLVQFSTAFCAPCRATRRTLAEVAGMLEGIAAVEVDAEANLGLARSLGIYSTPTVLVLGADGTILRRGVGEPRKPDVIAALGAIGSAADEANDMGSGSATGPRLPRRGAHRHRER